MVLKKHKPPTIKRSVSHRRNILKQKHPDTGRSVLSETLEPFRKEIRERLVEGGQSPLDIFLERREAYGVSYPALLEWIKTSGVKDKDPLSMFVLQQSVVSLDDTIASRLLELNESIDQIAENLNLDPCEIRWRLLAQGVDLSGEPPTPGYDCWINALLNANDPEVIRKAASFSDLIKKLKAECQVTDEQVAAWVTSKLAKARG